MRVSPVIRFRARSVAVVGVVALGVLGLLGAVGCRSVLDVDGYGLTEPGPFEGVCDRVEYASKACSDCIGRACCAEATACADDPSCIALSQCLARCAPEDLECRTRCNLSVRRTTAGSRLIACAAEECGSCAMGQPTFGGVACSRCLGDDALLRFGRSVSALEYEACQADCPAGNEDRCACDDYAGDEDAGRSIVEDLRAVAGCKVSCGEEDWSCLGSVQSPSFASRERLELRVSVARLQLDDQPVIGAEVVAYDELDNTVLPPPAFIDATGFAVLDLAPKRNLAYFGHLRVRWPEDEGVDNHALLYFHPPISRSPAWTWRRLVTRSQGDLAAQFLSDYGVTTPDWAKDGGIIWSAAACNGVPAEGLVASFASAETTFYIGETSFAPDPTLRQTSRVGLGAVFNVTPNRKSMTLRRGEKIVGEYEFYVLAGAITTLALSPSPESEL